MQAIANTGNWFAALSILLWPVCALALFQARPAAEATLWTILGALLLLPTGVFIKVPMIPVLDKSSVPNLCAFVGCLLAASNRRRAGPAFGTVEIFALFLIFGPVMTSFFNGDTIVVGSRVLPGVGLYDGISAFLAQLVLFLPFLLGRRMFQDSSDAELIVRSLSLAGLLYSLPMLLEIRLSPQLSNWIYGFAPSAFVHEVRYEGYRPVVFMKNGLTAAFFMATAFLCSVAMHRVKISVKPFPPTVTTIYLGLIVILCKSAGALLYSFVVGIVVRWLPPRTQIRIAIVLVSIAVLYPVLRITDTFPNEILVDLASSIDQKRADSLKFRFDQERQLLNHASERLVFGWGRYGRNRIYEESGKDSSVTDGAWIQTVGQFGLIGFVAQFGLLAWPVYRAASAYRYVGTERERVLLAVIALIVALGLVEQLPNSSISSWSWLLAGALLGISERILKRARNTRSASSHSRMSSMIPRPTRT